ncbi:MAG: hypothetical protein GX620_09975 [Chloroflexi bacterium]|nr:hypothetical protein [Chloroflexota bacterium]
MNLRTRVLMIGGVVGAMIGVAAAYLYLRSTPTEVDREGVERLPSPSPGKALTIGLSVLTVLKQITGLGAA